MGLCVHQRKRYIFGTMAALPFALFVLSLSPGLAGLLLFAGAFALGLIARSIRIRQALPAKRYVAFLAIAVGVLLVGPLVPDGGTFSMWLNLTLFLAASTNLLFEVLTVRKRSAEAAARPGNEA